MCAFFGNRYGNLTKSEETPLDPGEKYLRDFKTTEEELTVLLKDVSKVCRGDGDFRFPSISFIAYIDNETGEVIQDRGMLCWVIPNFSGDYIHEFEDYGICRVLVRRCRPDAVNYAGHPYKNRYHLVKILEKEVAEPRLETSRREYLKPVVIEDEAGTFNLDRRYNFFEGQIDWLGSSQKICLDKDPDGDTAENAFRTLRLFLSDVEKWDRSLRDYAARQLTDLANDWRQEDVPQITEQEFARRIGTPSIHINERGGFEAEYEDDDMFYGHWIVVYGDENGELKRANIEG